MIDFTNCKRLLKSTNGGESKKEWIIYDSKYYLLKSPSLYKINKDITYYNQCFSEYVSCHIFNLLDVKAQNTLLGINNEENNIVVACEDVTLNDYFKLYKLIDLYPKANNKMVNTISGIYDIINYQDKLDKDVLIKYFWDIFVVDAFVNNIDRDIKNIGILFNEKTNKYFEAPIYDLGRSLYDYLKYDTIIKIVNGDRDLLKEKIEGGSFSVLCDDDGKHINFVSFFNNCKNNDFKKAVECIKLRIDMGKIYDLIDNTPLLTDELKSFYKIILDERYKVLFELY